MDKEDQPRLQTWTRKTTQTSDMDKEDNPDFRHGQGRQPRLQTWTRKTNPDFKHGQGRLQRLAVKGRRLTYFMWPIAYWLRRPPRQRQLWAPFELPV